jgi:hypothetical protein
MEAARAKWTDPRLDDLKDTVAGVDEKVIRLDKKVDEGFARADKEVDDGFARLDKKFDSGLGRIDDRIDNLHHSIVAAFVALISIITVLLGALVGIIATHL